MNVVIFDFDGTIANTLKLADQVYLELTQRYNLKRFTKDEIHELKHLSFQERLKMHHINIFKLPRMMRRTRKIISKIILTTDPFVGIKELIESLKQEGYVVAIVSSNSKNNIKKFLDHHGFPQFDGILGKASIFGKDRLINKLMRRYPHGKPLYVGDELRDIISTQDIGCPIVAVTWGYDDKATLIKDNPDYIADDIETLKHIINSHFK